MPVVASMGAIYLFDEETSRLVPQACYGTHTSLRDLPSFALGEGIVGEVAKTGQPIEEKVGEGTVGPTGVPVTPSPSSPATRSWA